MLEQHGQLGSREKQKIQLLGIMIGTSNFMLALVLPVEISFLMFSDRIKLFKIFNDWHRSSDLFLLVKLAVGLITSLFLVNIASMLMRKMLLRIKSNSSAIIIFTPIFITILALFIFTLFHIRSYMMSDS